jgi:hypothetical protein
MVRRKPIKVLATSAYDSPEPLGTFLRVVSLDRFGVHELTRLPQDADIILFVENSHYHDDPYYKKLRRHFWVRQYREKCFMYNEQTRPWCVLPGLYPNMPEKGLNIRRQRTSNFVRVMNPYIAQIVESGQSPKYFFSFIGSTNAPVRDKIFRLKGPSIHIQDTTDIDFFYRKDKEVEAAKMNYAEIIGHSKFVLCPRGVGVSSFRLFETMQAGRVPVVLSDNWVPPEGPHWEEFLIRIPESQVHSISKILKNHESRYREMGQAARNAWLEWFSPPVNFHRFAEWLETIRESRRWPEKFMQKIPSLLKIESHARDALRPIRNRILRR